MTDRNCPWDGVPIPARLSGKQKKYCSKKCKDDHYAARQAWAQEQEASGAVDLACLKAALERKRNR